MPTLKELSKLDFNVEKTSGGNWTWDQIKISALARIADAAEAMSLRYNELLRDLHYYTVRSEELSRELVSARRSNSALRGVITRIQKETRQ